ncbi:MAG: hypothetical protein GX159_04975 [Flavobacteriaceae bacterium]|jgi:hypothetical protein|nr:hypothetical protein [Flavobacteriaceae bacterium]
MKKLILLHIIFLCIYAKAQQMEPLSVDEVETMAVFQGCEEFSKEVFLANSCLTKNLSDLVVDELFSIIQFQNLKDTNQIYVNLKFTLTKNGRIRNPIILDSNNEKIAQQSKIALLRVANKLNKNGDFISPARNKEGMPVDLSFNLPIILNIQ